MGFTHLKNLLDEVLHHLPVVTFALGIVYAFCALQEKALGAFWVKISIHKEKHRI